MSNEIITQNVTKSDSLTRENLLSQLNKINNELTVSTKEQLIGFLEKNEWLIEKSLPVNSDKQVVTGRRSSTACRMSLAGLYSILNNPGTLQRFDGVNDDEVRYDAVKASSIAIQHRYTTIAIDLDSVVFDGKGGSILPTELIEWVVRSYPYSLSTRGNRQRLTLLFKVSEKLKDHLITTKKSKKNFVLKQGKLQKVEIGYGTTNNTVFGVHPVARNYQQSYPENNLLGELSLESFNELISILEKNSIVKDPYRGKLGKGRVHLEDCLSEINSLLHEYQGALSLASSLKLNVDLELSIKDFLNPKTIQVIEKQAWFDGSSFQESEDDEFSIPSGGRYHTYFCVGSDVTTIAYIFNKAAIEFDEDEIDEILDTLWDNTDIEGNGTKTDKFSEDDASSAFFATSVFPTIKPDYLAKLIKKIRNEIVSRVQKEINEKKKHLGNEAVEDFEFSTYAIEGLENDNETQSSEELSKAFLFESAFVTSLSEPEELLGNVELTEVEEEDPFDVNEISGGISDDAKEQSEIFQAAIEDDWGIFGKDLRYLKNTIDSGETDGLSFAILTQTLSLLSGAGSYVTIKNKEFHPYKPDNALVEYRTKFIPFAAVVGDSSAGKSNVRRLHEPGISLIEKFTTIQEDEQYYFESQFGDGKGKFQKVEFEPGSSSPVNPTLAAVQQIVTYGARKTLGEFLSTKDEIVLNDLTDAGYREILLAQKTHVDIKDKTDGIHFPLAYQHPVCLYSDELNEMMKRIFNRDATFGGSTEFYLQRKGAKDLKVSRAKHNFHFDLAGLSIAGNMITDRVQGYLEREFEEGTDGVTPRFNFALINKQEDRTHDPKKVWERNRLNDAQVDMAGIMMAARYTSVHARQLVNCPYSKTNALSYDNKAHKVYGEFLEETKKIRNRLISKYPARRQYLLSLFGKASSELALYAGGINLLDQVSELWFQAKNLMGSTADIHDILMCNYRRDMTELGKQMMTNLEIVLPKFKWTLNISENQVKRATKIILHHYKFIEYMLFRIDEKINNDLAKRAKLAAKELTIQKAEGKAYATESQARKIIEGVVKTLNKIGEDKEFTISELSKHSHTVKTLKKNNQVKRIEDIIKILQNLDILTSTSVNTKGSMKYKAKCGVIQISERIDSICRSINKHLK